MKKTNQCAAYTVCVFALAVLMWASAVRSHGLAGGPRAKYFPKVALRTQDNKQVDFYDLIKGRTVIIHFMHTADETSGATENLVRVQKLLGDRLGRDVFIYSITVDPDRDTPAVLKQYAESHGVRAGWQFLTGNLQEIETLRRKLGVQPDAKIDTDRKQGPLRIGHEGTDRWAVTSALARPGQIVSLVNRMQPAPAK